MECELPPAQTEELVFTQQGWQLLVADRIFFPVLLKRNYRQTGAQTTCSPVTLCIHLINALHTMSEEQGEADQTPPPPPHAVPRWTDELRAIAHEYNSGFNPLQLHCWCYDVLQRIVPSCSDLPLGVSAVPESTTSGLRPRGLPVLAALSDMGNSANVNPPAKLSRADRTPIRSSERSPTGGGIPSGSSATHSETMCDIDEMSLAASEGDWHPTLTNPSSTPSGRVQDEAEVMSSVLTRGYVVPEPHFFTPRLGRLQASEISRDVCFPATQDPFDIGSGSCAPTGGTPEAEIEGETSTPSATFSREGTLTGRPQGEQHRARTFTATALIGRYGTAPASSPKPDPFQGLAPTYSQSFSVLPGCTCSRSHTPLDCARQTRPHALARRRVVYTRQLLPLSNRQCVQLSR
ncbi:hypothetical protein E1301_Tti016965 [Triplophysa tibetana]|uniref:Uncharacterized protein n=2 Tax=Triplophysa tibetana TaxID=1572043 RepID=A0A5A9N8V8_9TELE|nr:hypothetical protein E1301_Tti016965 [Triplophysa tibetana]